MRTMPDAPLLERSKPHSARSFTQSPDADVAVRLLGEIAAAPCAFSPVRMDRPLALYGAGSLGRLARDFLTSVGHDFAIAIDRNADELARDPYWSGVAIKHPDAISQADRCTFRVAVSIVTSSYVPIEQSLRQQGFDDVVPFYDLAESFRTEHPLSNGWFAPPLTSNDRANAAKVLAKWHDDESRAHHLQFLAWRRLREEWTFDAAPVVADNRFFIPEVTSALHHNEFFLDGGAHHGFVANAFVERTRNAFLEIVVIEPDAANRSVLASNLSAWLPRDPRITIYDCALSEHDGQALFCDGLGYASQISPLGQTWAKLCPLDALKLSPTFIKLHLEGAEIGALIGGRQTLRAKRPIIAATVYHNADGVWKTPLWLMENLDKYRFLFRSHGWCGTGAVVYAVPEERYAT
jgi:FkbM family methyltransferase